MDVEDLDLHHSLYNFGFLWKDFNEIADPSWIGISEPGHKPKPNPKRFRLEPALRALAKNDGSFHLDDQILEPSAEDL